MGLVAFNDPDGMRIRSNLTETEAYRSETTVTQHGDDHYAITIQAGSDDMITIQQQGTGSVAQVTQGTATPF